MRRALAIALLAAAFAAPSFAQTPTPTSICDYGNVKLSSTPVIYWKLNDVPPPSPITNAQDSSGNGFDGTGNTAPISQVGQVDRAGLFNGTNSAIQLFQFSCDCQSGGPTGCPCDPRFNSPSITLQAWVNTTASNGGIFRRINQLSGVSQYALGLRSDVVWFEISQRTIAGPSCANGTTPRLVLSPTTINDGDWHLVTGTYAADIGRQVLYIDGSPAAVTDWPIADICTTVEWMNMQLGAATEFQSGAIDVPSWNGGLDEFEYDDYAVPASYVLQVYNAGIGVCGTPSVTPTATLTPTPVASLTATRTPTSAVTPTPVPPTPAGNCRRYTPSSCQNFIPLP